MEENDTDDIGRQRMKEFYQLADLLFTKPERLILYKILKDYQSDRDVVRLVVGLNLVLRTYTKLELLKYVRYLVWEGHIDEFDRLTRFHSKFRRRRPSQHAHLLIPDHRSVASTSTSTSGHHIRDVRVFNVYRDAGEANLGFSVRGGSEHGLGIYISEIDTGSTADKSGLEVGDKILEVNNISLHGVASSSAVKVLTGSNRLKLVVQRTRKVPEWRLSREKTSWYDVHKKKLISGEFEECGISHNIRGLDVDVPERRVSLKFGKAHRSLGFNIRGGREYSLGIYISKVDRNGLAEKKGVRVGDQVIDVNGIPFDNITHEHAVEVLKGKKHLILTLRDVGRFPVFKELYAEYTWSNSRIKPVAGTSSLQNIPGIVVTDEIPYRTRSVADIFTNRRPNALQNEIFLPNARKKLYADDDDEIDRIHEGNDDDSDSLIDLDQWAHDIHSGGTENQAYDSDEESDSGVMIHRDSIDKSVRRETTERETVHKLNQAQNKENSSEDHIESEYDTPDMIYAKINKVDSRNVSTSNLSMHSTSGQNVELSSKETKSPPFKPKRKGLNRSSNENIYKATENRLAISEDELQTVTPTIDGALYSTVRKLSCGSFKNLGNPNIGVYGSNISLNDPSPELQLKNQELHEQGDSLQTTSQILSFSETNLVLEDSDSEPETGSYDLERAYSRLTKVKNTQNSMSVLPHEDQKSDNEYELDPDKLDERLQELQARQTHIGMQELNGLNRSEDQAGSVVSGSVRKKGKWRTFKNIVKGSLRLASPNVIEETSENRKSRSHEKIDGVSMAQMEEAARRLLNQDEFNAVNRHIKNYHTTQDLESLVEALLLILDKPEKLLLLKDVRGVIYQQDMSQFDNMVNLYEIEAYQKLSMKLHLPLNHKPQQKPRKKLITTEMESISTENTTEDDVDHIGEAKDGHFHIKTWHKSKKQKDTADGTQDSTATKAKQISPQRYVRKAEEKSALDQFQYLDFEQTKEGSSVAAFSEYGSHGTKELEKIPGSVIVHLSKTKQSIGIDFVEEIDNGERKIKIKTIDPHGAANDDSTIKVGMTLLAVDRQMLEGLGLEEVLGVIQTSYMDKQHVSMKLVLHNEESTKF